MLMPQVHQSELRPAILATRRSSVFSNTSIPVPSKTTGPVPTTAGKINGGTLRVTATSSPFIFIEKYKAQAVTVKAEVSVVSTDRFFQNPTDPDGGTIVLELVSSEGGGSEAQRIKGIARRVPSIWPWPIYHKYGCSFDVPASFGELGAVVVENERNTPMYFKTIVLSNFHKPITITCNSWVDSKSDKPNMRVFFTNKSYLPSRTPSGLKKLREGELESLRGNGEGERRGFDRIYDYDKYNDLGDPDKSHEMARPVLGGPDHPYPRRCRTGRGPTQTDPSSEKKVGEEAFIYVPMDEHFSLLKIATSGIERYAGKTLLKGILESTFDQDSGFPSFAMIDSLFNDGHSISDEVISHLPNEKIGGFVSGLISLINKAGKYLLLFKPPETFKRDRFSWLRDEEFSRQTLAGLNPLSIQLVTEWPIRSKLDTSKYGSPESAITKETVESQINGIMTLEEAMKEKKLFMLDYHDLLLPYVHKVRELDGTRTTLYGSRTLFFLCEDSTLKPIAIELTRPPMEGKPEWRNVFTPSSDATDSWLWKIAKAHVTSHDTGYHQLVIHWLRTHCCMEPYIVATNRQLSAMHPIYRLLHPHLRYTMEINAFGRKALINAGGIAESVLAFEKYSMEFTSVVYDQLWRFDMEALPADLIRRGMAVEDPTAAHGLKLTIEDYPFANDGLLLWDAIKSWVTDYVNRYYMNDKTIETDTELQAWWTDIRTKGHADKKDEPWWPVLNTADNLIQALSTIIWVASGHHAAVNYGQYAYAGYFPNRPTIARTNVPIEDPTETHFMSFITKPEETLLECFPSQIQATSVMAVFDLLSDHSIDEEYIGQKTEPSWSEDSIVKAAFDRFQAKVKLIGGTIDGRNLDPKLKNRTGAGVVPYELLKPISKPGVTGMGVPNSISI